MASFKEMRTRIGSVKSTQKITKAMQMVAAAKLRRAQTAAENARPYARLCGCRTWPSPRTTKRSMVSDSAPIGP